jgi:hypothetical protein
MSKLFFDHLIEFKKIDKQIKSVAKNTTEREELWAIVDEIVHHKVVGCVLDKLPKENHEEFLEVFHNSPHDEEIVFGYLKSRVGEDIKEIIKKEIIDLEQDLLKEINEK